MTLESSSSLIILTIRLPMMTLNNIKRGFQFMAKMIYYHKLKGEYPVLETFYLPGFRKKDLESSLNLINFIITLPMMTLGNIKRGYNYLIKTLQ